MNDHELDQALKRWRTPAPSPQLRARVLAGAPDRRRFRPPLRWALALAATLGLLAIASAQNGRGALESLSTTAREASDHMAAFFDHIWIAHIVSAFGNSEPKVYIDGELQSGEVFQTRGARCSIRLGRDKYYVLFSAHAFEGPVPPPAGRFDGHVLEFQAGGRAVRVEARHHYGFGGERPVYVKGPVTR